MEDKEYEVEVNVAATFKLMCWAEDEDDAGYQAEEEVRNEKVSDAVSFDVDIAGVAEKGTG